MLADATQTVLPKKMGSGLKPIYFCYVLDFTGKIGFPQSLCWGALSALEAAGPATTRPGWAFSAASRARTALFARAGWPLGRGQHAGGGL
jgi:hypothetical protein